MDESLKDAGRKAAHLDIAVCDAQSVAVLHSHQHLLEDVARLLFWHSRALLVRKQTETWDLWDREPSSINSISDHRSSDQCGAVVNRM